MPCPGFPNRRRHCIARSTSSQPFASVRRVETRARASAGAARSPVAQWTATPQGVVGAAALRVQLAAPRREDHRGLRISGSPLVPRILLELTRAGVLSSTRAVYLPNRETCMKRAWKLSAAVLALASSAAHAAIVFNEGDFSTWIFGSYGSGGGTATMTREATGGNPGARLNATTVTGGPTAFGYATALNPSFSTTATLAGTPVTVALDVLSGPGAFGQGQSILVLVEQGGAVYALDLGFTNVVTPFTRLTFGGTLNAGSFTLVQGTGPATPNFNGGVVTRFGLATANSNSGTLTQFYDNVALDISPVNVTPTSTAPIPTLSEWALIALIGLVAMFGMRRTVARRRP